MSSGLNWMELTRPALQKYIKRPFDELCYSELVMQLMLLAGEEQGKPERVLIAFSRHSGGELQIHAQCVIRGEPYDYAAWIPDEWHKLDLH